MNHFPWLVAALPLKERATKAEAELASLMALVGEDRREK